MNSSEPTQLTLLELRQRLGTREVSAVEVTRAFLERVSERNRDLNCYVTISTDRALKEANELDDLSEVEQRDLPLFGIPVALKDNIATKDVPTTAGSPLLKGWIPPRDATVVSRLARAGAVVLGKLSMYQFAVRSPHPEFGDVRNPWDPTKCCAGSSSGSGAAVAAGLAAATLGTDTAGSLRLPAAVCGVVGLKPTYGLVSTAGVLPAAPLLDHVGPLTRTAADGRLLLAALTGDGSLTAARLAEDHGPVCRGISIAVPRPQSDLYIDDEMLRAYERALETLECQGARVVEVELPSFTELNTVVYTLAAAEVADVHRKRLTAYPDGYSPDVRQLILAGALIPAPAYVQARRLKRRLSRKLDEVLRSHDVIASPVIPMPAWDIGPGVRVRIAGALHDAFEAMTLYAPPANLAGLPAVSLPCGYTQSGLPLAFQLMGRRRDDDRLLRIAAEFQAVTGWHLERPA